MKGAWSFSSFSGKEWTPGVKDVSSFKATAGPASLDRRQFLRTAGQTATALAAVSRSPAAMARSVA